MNAEISGGRERIERGDKEILDRSSSDYERGEQGARDCLFVARISVLFADTNDKSHKMLFRMFWRDKDRNIPGAPLDRGWVADARLLGVSGAASRFYRSWKLGCGDVHAAGEWGP